MWFAARKTGQELIHNQDNEPPLRRADFVSFIIENYGGAKEDYSFYRARNGDRRRLRNGDDFNLLWENNEITGINFDVEDNKRLIVCSDPNNKTFLLGDGISERVINIQVLKPDQELDTSFNGQKQLPIITPSGQKFCLCNFNNGVVTLKLKTKQSGDWIIPAKGYRNDFKYTRPMRVRVFEVDIS
jgi:hypothetical protein